MVTDMILESIQVVVTVLGLAFIWVQIKRSRKDAITGSLVTSLSERWLAIEERRMNIKEGEAKVYYKFLIPELEGMFANEYKGNLRALANALVFNETDRGLQDKEKVFDIIVREYADSDALFNLAEEEFMAGKYLRLVDEKLWRSWEYYLRIPFRSQRMRNYWKLRTKVGATFPAFVDFVEEHYLSSPPERGLED
jgi:hypothetical protein